MTLKDVAQQAGVSTSTASRYLRGQLNVQPETAARIDDAVAAIGYKVASPSHGATPGMSTVAMVLPDLTNPFFAALAEECTDLAAARGIVILIAISGTHGERESSLSQLFASNDTIDAIIYVGMNRSNDRLAKAVADGLPVVVIDEEIDLELAVDTITVDNYGGAYQATSYLIQLGHTRIAHVAGPQGLSTTQERLRGYLDALTDAGLHADPDLVRHGPYTEQFGASTFPYLTRPGNAPSAAFVGSDIVAVGMLGAAELHGISIPEDLSVVGCDGIRVGQWLRPKLTTLEQPIHGLAQAALDTVSRRITERRSSPAVSTIDHAKTVLPLHLVIRGSAATVPGTGDVLDQR
ncbi:transcriptional regulator, LacI family [Sanguibacter gelidistatuariae]|uniref:Transcriptional regulator, LacI family n=1 Tax=Sanguibacter gelidistatuariae TaxID=1814289 RepID=A0A1G6XNE6_9MICO|nr:transcriptional regulator, LacI family [Sanguibacter gelidistatuariae]